MSRKWLGRLSIGLFIVFVVSVADIALYLAMDSGGPVRALPDSLHAVTGTLEKPVANTRINKDSKLTVEDVKTILEVHSDSPSLSPRILDIAGKSWRGEVEVDPLAPAGHYTVRVRNKAGGEGSVVNVHVFADPGEMNRSYYSLAKRYLGVGPWFVTLAVIPLAGVILFLVYLRSGRELEQLQSMGLGPIYKLARRKDSWDMVFGLGAKHGVRKGDRLTLVTANRVPVGELVVLEVKSETSSATLPLDAAVAPDFLIMRPMGASAMETEQSTTQQTKE